MKNYKIYVLLFSLLIAWIFIVIFILSSVSNNWNITDSQDIVIDKAEEKDQESIDFSEQEVIKEGIDNQINIQDQEKMDISLINQVWRNGTLSTCDSIISEEMKNKCLDNGYLFLASEQNDKKYCVKVKDIQSRSKCLDNFLYNDSIQSKNIQSCSKISDIWLKETCMSNLIFEQIDSQQLNIDEKICDNLQSDNKQYCLETIESKNSQLQDVDFLNIAISKNDVESCKKITNIPL